MSRNRSLRDSTWPCFLYGLCSFVPAQLACFQYEQSVCKRLRSFLHIFIALFQRKREGRNCLVSLFRNRNNNLVSLWIHMRNLGFWSVFKFDICQDVCKDSLEINPCSYTQPWLLIFFFCYFASKPGTELQIIKKCTCIPRKSKKYINILFIYVYD